MNPVLENKGLIPNRKEQRAKMLEEQRVRKEQRKSKGSRQDKENNKEISETENSKKSKILVKLLKKRRENKIPNNRNERGFITTDSINTSIILREFDKHVMPPNLTNQMKLEIFLKNKLT